MLSNSHTIPDLKEKIILLISNEVNKISSQAILSRVSKIGAPTINKWLKHSYEKIGESDFKKLNKTYENIISEELWFQPITKFAQKLNLKWVSPQTPPIESLNKIGCNFESRIKDKEALQATFDIMEGYWEQYRYAISNEEKKCIVYALIEVKSLSSDSTFECTKTEYNLEYKGYFYQGHQNLFFKLQEKNPANGEVFMIANLPNTDREPKVNGILLGLTADSPSLYPSPAATKVALRYVGSLKDVKEKYGINDNDISLRDLTEKIHSIIISNRDLIAQDVFHAIDNHIPHNAVPYALRTSKYNPAFTAKELLVQLKNTLNDSLLGEVEKKCFHDYLNLLNNAMYDGEYRFIKLSDYYYRIGILAKDVTKSIIATYIYESYNHDCAQLAKFSNIYFETQAKFIREKGISVCRIFIIKTKEPNDFLLKKMHREEQAGIEVLYLQENDWVNSSLRITYIVDFAMFDETKAVMLGEKEPFSSVQTASLVTNKTKISELKELFYTNKERANYLTDEMRQKAQRL